MNIIVTKSEDIQNIIKEIVSKDLICPECKENSLINLKIFMHISMIAKIIII